MSEDADAGTSMIASLFGSQPAAGLDRTGPGIEADAALGLHVAVGNLVDELRAEAARRRRLTLEVAYVSAPVVSSAASPYAQSDWGPGKGWAWAVQRFTVAGFGATTDFVTAYRANSTSGTVPANALFTFQEAVAGGTATWHPGRTGLILRGDESLAFGGTITATITVSVDVNQLADSKLPYFLL